MGRRKGNGGGHRKWVEGEDFPLFSGKSWRELEDIWPKSARLSSDAWRVVSVFAPALHETKQFYKNTYGENIDSRDLFLLAWMQRCEEFRENVAFKAFPVLHGIGLGGKMFYIRKAKMTKMGLLENIPMANRRLYRVSGTGKMILKKFIENIEKAHKDVVAWSTDWSIEDEDGLDKSLRDIIKKA